MARMAAMAVVAILLLGFFGYLIFRFTTPTMAPLYSGLSLDDSSAIVSELRSQNVPFELRGDGETVLVPRDQITQLRMSLAGNGLPTRGQVGYEIFDQQSTLGATSFVQNVNQLRALEGELARTISSLTRVKSARVHLVIPERALFQQNVQSPTAAIMLSVRGELSAGEIRAIQHLVASSVEGMSANRVSIVDDTGRLLAAGDENSSDGLVSSDIEDRTSSVETRLKTRLEDLLNNVVGPGRARVQVAVELDLNRQTRTQESYDPNGQVVRSTQTKDASSQSGSADNGVSVSGNLPNAGTSTAPASGNLDNTANTEETVNYEISKTTETEVSEAGGIKRLSVAVAVDGIYTQNANGAATYTPRDQAELDQLTALVRSAVGYDAQRGDTVEVVNLQFAARPDIVGQGSDGPGLFDFTRDDLFNFANMAVTLIIALALVLFVMRPLLRRVLEPESEMLELPQTAEVAPVSAAAEAIAHNAEMEQQPAQNPQWMDQARQHGEAQVQTLKQVGNIVEEHPRQATVIVRDWLNRAA